MTTFCAFHDHDQSRCLMFMVDWTIVCELIFSVCGYFSSFSLACSGWPWVWYFSCVGKAVSKDVFRVLDSHSRWSFACRRCLTSGNPLPLPPPPATSITVWTVISKDLSLSENDSLLTLFQLLTATSELTKTTIDPNLTWVSCILQAILMKRQRAVLESWQLFYTLLCCHELVKR